MERKLCFVTAMSCALQLCWVVLDVCERDGSCQVLPNSFGTGKVLAVNLDYLLFNLKSEINLPAKLKEDCKSCVF